MFDFYICDLLHYLVIPIPSAYCFVVGRYLCNDTHVCTQMEDCPALKFRFPHGYEVSPLYGRGTGDVFYGAQVLMDQGPARPASPHGLIRPGAMSVVNSGAAPRADSPTL